MKEGEKIKVILADDHKIIRDGLISLLQREPEIEVVAHTDSGREVIQLVRKTLPDVAVLDIGMKDISGIEAAGMITAEFPEIKVIALSMHSDRRYVEGMFKAGASGYLLKESAYTELIHAIQAVTSNEIYLSPQINRVLAGNLLQHNDEKDLSILSEREIEVLTLLAEGKSVKQIALDIYLSPKTVETHRHNIMKKLDINNIAGLTRYAIREGLIST